LRETSRNLDALAELEVETGQSVYTILQLRVHPSLIKLREKLLVETGKRHRVDLTYITSRGPWYQYSWKGYEERSGGVITNIGIHFFDLLMWLFGDLDQCTINRREPKCASGTLTLERADITWSLSIDKNDLPFQPEPGKNTTFRSITVDGEEIEFSGGFTDLHTRVYEETISGRGFGLEDARLSIELVHRLRTMEVGEKGERR